jgi:ribosomal protein L9
MEPIKEIGTHEVAVKIAAGIDATISVEVVPEAE